MPRPDLESLFLENLPAAEKILSALGHRHGLSRDDAEEFSAWAKLRLIENDYAILAKFRGESTLTTYLTVVLAMLFREYRVQQWGRWRPSAAARRSGSVAIRLETLTQRDGLPLTQAGEILRTSGETTLSDRQLGALLTRFPRRSPLRPVQYGEPVVEAAADDRADAMIQGEEGTAASRTVQSALVLVLETLPSEDRLLVRLHYMEAMSVADIARGLSLPQKPLYRRLERALSTLRAGLERLGVSREDVLELAAGVP